MNVDEIIGCAYNNELYYSTKFYWKNKTVLVFSVNSFYGLKKFKNIMKDFIVQKVIDAHNENYLVGVIV